MGVRTTISQLQGVKILKKRQKIGSSRHLQAKMPKSYNGNIFKIVSSIKLKFEA